MQMGSIDDMSMECIMIFFCRSPDTRTTLGLWITVKHNYFRYRFFTTLLRGTYQHSFNHKPVDSCRIRFPAMLSAHICAHIRCFDS
jgi:hypothetical protein